MKDCVREPILGEAGLERKFSGSCSSAPCFWHKSMGGWFGDRGFWAVKMLAIPRDLRLGSACADGPDLPKMERDHPAAGGPAHLPRKARPSFNQILQPDPVSVDLPWKSFLDVSQGESGSFEHVQNSYSAGQYFVLPFSLPHPFSTKRTDFRKMTICFHT